MTSYRDFDSEYSERQNYGVEAQGKSPGVYVRDEGHELPRELDMLWSGNKALQKEERPPFLAFSLGFLLGALLSAAVCWLLFIRPQVHTEPNDITAPLKTGSEAATPQNSRAATLLGNSTSYTVVSGDTLGRIALKVYGSAEPRYLEKIQRANAMKNPNSLQLNQTLTIPPKQY
jgi:LysM repeat protein